MRPEAQAADTGGDDVVDAEFEEVDKDDEVQVSLSPGEQAK